MIGADPESMLGRPTFNVGGGVSDAIPMKFELGVRFAIFKDEYVLIVQSATCTRRVGAKCGFCEVRQCTVQA